MSYHWKNEFAVGHAEIDLQHQTLFELINRLEVACRNQAGREQMESILTGLLFYTQTHFAFEEELMKSVDYPDLDAHRSRHYAAIITVRNFKDRFISGEPMAEELLGFMSSWLEHHILGEDQRYAPYLNGAPGK